MRYPLNSESVKDPVRFARTWETRNPTEETARALVAQERGKKTLTLSQVFWSPHMGPCCNPDGMGLPILKRLCRLRA